jgi:hypothetical protein
MAYNKIISPAEIERLKLIYALLSYYRHIEKNKIWYKIKPNAALKKSLEHINIIEAVLERKDTGNSHIELHEKETDIINKCIHNEYTFEIKHFESKIFSSLFIIQSLMELDYLAIYTRIIPGNWTSVQWYERSCLRLPKTEWTMIINCQELEDYSIRFLAKSLNMQMIKYLRIFTGIAEEPKTNW